MENSEDHSSCGCKAIFCCMFSSSRKNHPSPAYSASTSEWKPTPLWEQENLKKNAAFGAPDVGQHVHQPASRLGSDVNQAFSDYINQARIKIRAMPNVGSDGGEINAYAKPDEVCDYDDAEKKADVNDMFSDYINRSKLKIRKTSSIGSKRIISFRKRE